MLFDLPFIEKQHGGNRNLQKIFFAMLSVLKMAIGLNLLK